MPATNLGLKIEHLTSAIADLEDATRHLNNYTSMYDSTKARMSIVSLHIGPLQQVLFEVKKQRDYLMELANASS